MNHKIRWSKHNILCRKVNTIAKCRIFGFFPPAFSFFEIKLKKYAEKYKNIIKIFKKTLQNFLKYSNIYIGICIKKGVSVSDTALLKDEKNFGGYKNGF